jgi:hypothetical protein
MKIGAAAVFFCLLFVGMGSAQMYIWVDEDGVKNYSNAPPPAILKGSQHKVHGEVVSEPIQPETIHDEAALEDENEQDPVLRQQGEMIELYEKLLNQVKESRELIENPYQEITGHDNEYSQPDPETEKRKKNEEAELISRAYEETGRLKSEYKDALFDCSNRYFRDSDRKEKCRDRVHDHFEKRLEQLKEDPATYFKYHARVRYVPRNHSLPASKKSGPRPVRIKNEMR